MAKPPTERKPTSDDGDDGRRSEDDKPPRSRTDIVHKKREDLDVPGREKCE